MLNLLSSMFRCMLRCFKLPTRHERRKSISRVQTVHRLDSQYRRSGSQSTRRAKRDSELSRDIFPGDLLSQYQKHWLRKSWSQVEPLKETFGTEIYTRVFEADPRLKMLFLWEDLSLQELVQTSQFQKQAATIIATVALCVQKVDNIQVEMGPRLQYLGKRHTRFRGYGFTPYHWSLFGKSMLQSLKDLLHDSPELETILQAWDILTDYIVAEMRTGYDQTVIAQQSYLPDYYSSALTLESGNGSPNTVKTESKRSSMLSMATDGHITVDICPLSPIGRRPLSPSGSHTHAALTVAKRQSVPMDLRRMKSGYYNRSTSSFETKRRRRMSED